MKKRPFAFLLCLTMLLTGCAPKTPVQSAPDTPADTAPAATEQTPAAETPAQETEKPQGLTAPANLSSSDITYMARPTLISNVFDEASDEETPAVQWQTPAADLSDVYIGNYGSAVHDPKQKQLLAQNGFFLQPGYRNEYFENYEMNRYSYRANYITTDSMMHTYHLYFAYLLKKLERGQLNRELLEVSQLMISAAQKQYDTLQGTEWEEAAKTELAFFAVGASLLDAGTAVPDAVKSEVAAELQLISDAGGISNSVIFTKVPEDYTQYIPRGYYDTSEDLQRYFKAMMWYGRMGFRQDNETLNRASVLITLAMDGDALDKWEHIYTVTSFFAGASDDFGYYEEKPVVDSVYGSGCTVDALVGRDDLWATFTELCKHLPAPQINSVPVYLADSDEEAEAAQKGFRFMGQRFSIDESCFTQLCFRQVKENADGERRVLPDVLDFTAALGSETSLQILDELGKTDYPNYKDQMDMLRTTVHNAPKPTWTANLYSSWIYTLRPLLEEKGTAYPPFMQTDAWRKKSLVTFAGSYTELKHDTILYSKQMMGEMGGGDIEEYDDRGFVEAEPLVFARLKTLVSSTADGLEGYGMLDPADKENLNILAELSGKLETIARKELSGELPTDDEFELIRTFGGQLEHFWEEVMDAEYPDEQYHSPLEHPAAIVADIATDPNGWCLEVGTGNPMDIYVIVQVDGQLKIASGTVFSFYQFEQPLTNRLTDTTWRQMLGINPHEDGSWEKDKSVHLPDWYSDLVYEPSYD